MPMYNLIEDNDNYLKWSGFLWHYYSDEQALTDVDPTANFLLLITVLRLNLNKKLGKTTNGGRKSVEIIVTLKYLN